MIQKIFQQISTWER